MSWRGAVVAVVVALAGFGTAACRAPGSTAVPSPAPDAAPTASLTPSAPPPSPAALAGGACLLLDYATVAKTVGTRFDVAGAADTSETYTCVLQRSNASLPTLTLSITATDLNTLDFTTDVIPAGSTPVSGLGRIGYSIGVSATSSLGPGVEVGWLSGNDRLILVRYVFPKGTATSSATALTPKLVALAKLVDQTTV